MRIVVVGAGVIGLSVAVRLREAGHDVGVWTRELPAETTSHAAAGLLHPHDCGSGPEVPRWAATSLGVFTALAGEPDSGVRLLPGRVLSRAAAAEPWVAARDPRPCPPDQLPAGYAGGWEFTLPVVDMHTYLPWLRNRLVELGGYLVRRVVDRLETAAAYAEAVVNCTGIAAADLVGDYDVTPVRGQSVRVADPGVAGWLVDEDHPAGPVVVVPHGGQVYCGVTVEEDELSRKPDPDDTAAILARCAERVPALAGAEPCSAEVGLRPHRQRVRLDRDGSVIHCYGHGAAGVTLSWGCAADVVALLAGG